MSTRRPDVPAGYAQPQVARFEPFGAPGTLAAGFRLMQSAARLGGPPIPRRGSVSAMRGIEIMTDPRPVAMPEALYAALGSGSV